MLDLNQYIKNWKNNLERKCWFCKKKYVKKKQIGLGYICSECKIKMGHLQMY